MALPAVASIKLCLLSLDCLYCCAPCRASTHHSSLSKMQALYRTLGSSFVCSNGITSRKSSIRAAGTSNAQARVVYRGNTLVAPRLTSEPRSSRRSLKVQAGSINDSTTQKVLPAGAVRCLYLLDCHTDAKQRLPPSAAAFAPPTVSDTKAKFLKSYTRPVPAIYNTVVQELLVQQHFIRYGVNYQYNAVGATDRSREQSH